MDKKIEEKLASEIRRSKLYSELNKEYDYDIKVAKQAKRLKSKFSIFLDKFLLPYLYLDLLLMLGFMRGFNISLLIASIGSTVIISSLGTVIFKKYYNNKVRKFKAYNPDFNFDQSKDEIIENIKKLVKDQNEIQRDIQETETNILYLNKEYDKIISDKQDVKKDLKQNNNYRSDIAFYDKLKEEFISYTYDEIIEEEIKEKKYDTKTKRNIRRY